MVLETLLIHTVPTIKGLKVKHEPSKLLGSLRKTTRILEDRYTKKGDPNFITQHNSCRTFIWHGQIQGSIRGQKEAPPVKPLFILYTQITMGGYFHTAMCLRRDKIELRNLKRAPWV